MFWRKKKIKETPVTDKVAGKLAGGIIYLQTAFSKHMSKIVAGMTIRKVKVFLFVFCIISGGLSIYFIVSSLTSNRITPMKIERVRMPKHLQRPGDEIMDNSMPPDIYQQIQDYKLYMDSLGEPIRPSLLDSMTILEQIYLQPQNESK